MIDSAGIELSGMAPRDILISLSLYSAPAARDMCSNRSDSFSFNAQDLQTGRDLPSIRNNNVNNRQAKWIRSSRARGKYRQVTRENPAPRNFSLAFSSGNGQCSRKYPSTSLPISSARGWDLAGRRHEVGTSVELSCVIIKMGTADDQVAFEFLSDESLVL